MQNTSSMIVAAPESIARVLEKFRDDIRNNAFTVSPSANKRMVSRAISHTEMYDVVANGQAVTGRRIPDYIGGRFFLNGLFVAVYAPFNDRDAYPCVVSVYRDGEPDDVEVADLPTVTDVQNLKQQVETLSKKVSAAAESLSIEELEELLARRKAQREEELAEQAALERAEKMARRQELLADKAAIDREIIAIEAELGLDVQRFVSNA